MDTKDRILKNTIFLYIRSFFTLILALFTSRVVLEALGVENFGVYQLVGGIVAAISFLNGTMSSATQRYLSYEIGLGNSERIRKTFSTAVNVHFIFSGFIFIAIIISGQFLLRNHLDTGSVNFSTAQWVLLFSALSVVLTINSVPYNSFLVAQENMSYFAYIDILGGILKLGVGYLLFCFIDGRLFWYAFLMFIVSLILRVLYVCVTKTKYEDARYYFVWDTHLIKNMIGFSGWVSFAAFAYMIKTQGLSIILNMFFGPLLNAAIGIGNQVNTAIRTFSQNFQMSFAPQIVKTYAKTEYTKMNRLILSGAKLSTYLLIFFSLPIIIETKFVLGLWLKEVPPYAPVIVCLILVETIIETLTCTGNQAIRATGKVKWYEMTYNIFQILALPVIIVYLHFGQTYYIPSLIIVTFIFFSTFIKLSYLKKLIPNFDRKKYIKQVVIQVFAIILVSICLPILCCHYLQSSFVRFGLNVVLFESVFIAIVVWKGLEEDEKLMLAKAIRKIIRR